MVAKRKVVRKRTRRKRTTPLPLNAKNLQLLGRKRLAELLVNISAGDAGVKRRLRLELAIVVGPEAVLRLARTRLGSVAKAKSKVPVKQLPALLLDLAVHHDAIVRSTGAAHPELRMEMLWLLLAAHRSVRNRCPFGIAMSDFHHEVIRDLGDAAAAALPDPARLAEEVFQGLIGGGVFNERLIPTLAPTMGAEGLAHLKQRLRARDTTSRVGRSRLMRIAEAEGDPDEYVRLNPPEERKRPWYAADVARVLLAADRAGDALRILDEAEGGPEAKDPYGEPEFDWADARIAALDALGRHEEAQEQRWQCFDLRLSAPHLRALLARFPDFDSMEAEERAFDHAERSHDPLAVLDFLVSWPDLARASALVLRQVEALNGRARGILERAAEALAARFPLAATLVLRRMIDTILADEGMIRRTRRVRSRLRIAARYLTDCAGLAAGIADFGQLPSHEDYVALLRKRYDFDDVFWSWVK